MSLEQAVQLVSQIKENEAVNRLFHYDPYPYQHRFHEAKGLNGELVHQRLLMAANKVGKTFCGAAEIGYHCTGIYPKWWKGHRFNRPVKVWAAGKSNSAMRDVVQAELMGDPLDPADFGRGAIPSDKIGKTDRLPGIPNALSNVLVKHISGRNSQIQFKSYEQGIDAWMGKAVDIVWLDEEPPQDIYSQALRATLKTNGIVFMTFTPESGMTEVVSQFMNDLKPSQMIYQATWDDAPHITKEVRENFLSAIPPHQREMRSKGIPVLGSGLVFPVKEEDIQCDAFEIPSHWPRIAAIDFGWDHPTAVVWVAWDRDGDVAYIYDAYRQSAQVPLVHAEAIKSRGSWIPMAWPHDGMQHDKGSGETLSKIYRKHGVNMLGSHFQNPEGGQSVEAGVGEMLTRFQTKRLQVFKHLNEWFEEFRMYHRANGKLVKERDDLMSASRYGVQSLRYATIKKPINRMDHAIGTYDSEYDFYGKGTWQQTPIPI